MEITSLKEFEKHLIELLTGHIQIHESEIVNIELKQVEETSYSILEIIVENGSKFQIDITRL